MIVNFLQIESRSFKWNWESFCPFLSRGMLIRGLILCLVICSIVSARSREKDFSEDSLQAMVAREPDNPLIWFRLGALAAKSSQVDLAKGYFDEAIKLSNSSAKSILDVGNLWLSLGKVKTSLTYLMPNLAHLEPENLDILQAGLEREKSFSAQLLVLRNLGSRTKAFQPVNRKAAALAFRLGDLALTAAILTKFSDQLDFESARNLLLINFFTSGTLDPKIPLIIHEKFLQGEIDVLINLNYAQQGNWRKVKDFLKREANSPSYRDYYNLILAMQAASEDRSDDAVAAYLKAQETTWDRLRVVVDADLYRLYSSTGNKFKSDQIWETLKEQYQNKDPEIQEFMAKQLQLRGYEKQSKYFFRVVLRRKPGNLAAVQALWEDLFSNEDYQTLTENLKVMVDREPLSCDANLLAMNFYFKQKNDKELLPYARNATVYCFEAIEPYFVLGTTLLNLSKPEEARSYFSSFVRKGGDANRVPVSLK